MSQWKPKGLKSKSTVKGSSESYKSVERDTMLSALEALPHVYSFACSQGGGLLEGALAMYLATETILRSSDAMSKMGDVVISKEEFEKIYNGLTLKLTAIMNIGHAAVIASMKDGTYQEKYAREVDTRALEMARALGSQVEVGPPNESN